MTGRSPDGSVGDADYGTIGRAYSRYRQPEPAIAARIHEYLGNSAKVLNVGAGAGSYEPRDRLVTAVEPSATMRAQRPDSLAVAIDAVAEQLPLPDQHFDAAMAIFTVHQWSDLQKGISEMRRVTRGRIINMTCDPDELCRFGHIASQYAGTEAAKDAKRTLDMSRLGRNKGELKILPTPKN